MGILGRPKGAEGTAKLVRLGNSHGNGDRWTARMVVLTVVVVILFVASGIFTLAPVSPASVPRHVGFARASAAPDRASAFQGYNVTFHESGLPSGTNWSVTFNSVTQFSDGYSSIYYAPIPNGSYAFSVPTAAGLDASPASGTVPVAGLSVRQNITFVLPPGEYAVTFQQTGLPRGTSWGVTFNGTYQPAGFRGLTFQPFKNGSYSWNTSNALGLIPSPASGTIVINGASVTQNITFNEPPGQYTVTFAEKGIARGLTFAVTFNSTLYSTNVFGGTTSIVVLHILPKSYPWNTTLIGYSATPGSGTLNVATMNMLQNITFAPIPGEYAVQFAGFGPTTWTVTFNGTLYTTSSYIISVGGMHNGTYAYSVGAVSGWEPTTNASGVVTVAGAGVTVFINWTQVVPGFYGVMFDQTGIHGGIAWSVFFNGTTQLGTGPTMAFIAPGGTLPYTVTAPAGYLASPSSGNVTVSASTAPVQITFRAVFTVAFTEVNLPSGTNWSVTLNGMTVHSTTPTLGFGPYINGTYSFTIPMVDRYAPANTTGSVTISGTNVGPLSVVFTFVPMQYAVTFTAVGLPAGTSWSVNNSATTVTAPAGTPIVFNEPNTTFLYTVANVAGYSISPASGSITVQGGPASQQVNFTKIVPPYTVTFTEQGLAGGTTWGIEFNGTYENASTASLDFTVKAGTYNYRVLVPSGYSVGTAQGTLTVSGNATSTVTFTATSSGGSSGGGAGGLSGTTLYIVIGVVAVVVVGVLVVVLMRKKTPPAAPASDAQGSAGWDNSGGAPPHQ